MFCRSSLILSPIIKKTQRQKALKGKRILNSVALLSGEIYSPRDVWICFDVVTQTADRVNWYPIKLDPELCIGIEFDVVLVCGLA